MTSRRVWAGVLVVLGIVWLFVNGPVEGPILFRFDADHGLTVADLLSVAAFASAALLFLVPAQALSRR